ncbi:MAG: hypothetical protein R2940_15270 [Syntrophotaleaceae bacterium]
MTGKIFILFILLAWATMGSSTVIAGGAGKSPECIGNCGRELSDCTSGCRPNAECFDRCKQISALFVDDILECQNNCADEISTCEDLCLAYNKDCVENCPEKNE